MHTKEKFRKQEFVYLLLVTVIVIFLYSFSWHYPIYGGWDDMTYILSNPHLSFSFSNILRWFKAPYHHMYIPITMISYMFDYGLWGLNSFGYHLQNIFWHIVTVIAIYKCFRLFNIKSWIAFFLCLIFAVHPQRVESVVWLSERKDVLCAAFYFLSIYFYIRNYGKKFSAIAFVLFLMSIFSKSMAISLPLILLLYEFCQQKKINIKYYFVKLWPYFVVISIVIPIAILTQGESINSNSHFLSSQRYYRVLFNLFWYFKQTFLPNELNPIYPLINIPNTIMGLIIFYIPVIITFVIISFKNRLLSFFCIMPILLCYIFSILPIGSFILLGGTDHADRYSYIPSVFIWFSFGLILTKTLYGNNFSIKKSKILFIPSRKFTFIILLVYSAILIELNYQYQKIWHTHYSVFYYAADSISANPVALHYLAELELYLGNYDNVVELTKQLEQKNKNSLVSLYLKATVKYYSTNKTDASKLLLYILPLYRSEAYKYHDTNSHYLKILNMLIDYSYSTGDTKKAIEYINEMLSYKRLNKFKKCFYHGIKTYYLKDYKTAISWFNKALELKPNDKKTKENIKICVKAQKEEIKQSNPPVAILSNYTLAPINS
jgi:hypothetical protein